MKKTLLFLFYICLSITLLSQEVKVANIISEKEYPNNTKTCYVKLIHSISPDLDILIKNYVIESDSRIINFSFFDKEDYSKFMYTSETSVTVDNIIEKINEAINQHIININANNPENGISIGDLIIEDQIVIPEKPKNRIGGNNLIKVE